MAYRTAKQTAAEWNIDVRVVQLLCKAGRIAGAQKYGAAWMIPAGAKKPADARRKSDAPPPLYPSLCLNENTCFDGRSADAIAAEFKNSAYISQFYAEIAYLQGDMEEARALLENTPKDDALSLCSLHLRNIVCINMGDYSAFVDNMRALDAMYSRYKAQPREAACIELSQATAITCLYAVERCPEWIKNGDFSDIPAEGRLYAIFVYTKYLHASGQIERLLGVTEAALNLSDRQGFTITELHLMIIRAIAFTQIGQTLRARELLFEAFALARPYRIYQPFSENLTSFRGVLDMVLKESFPEDYKHVVAGWNTVYSGWTDIHNRITGANVPARLTLREHQIGLYLCQGLSHKEIAARMGLRPFTISNYTKSMRDKLGVATSAELIQRMRWI